MKDPSPLPRPAAVPSGTQRPSLCTLILLLTLFSACPEAPRETIPLGLIVGGTYEEAAAARFAADLAIGEINAHGGIEVAGRRRPVELFVANTEETPEGALQAARGLISEHQILAMVGPNRSREALAVAPLAEKMQILMLSPKSTHPAVTEGRQWVFRLVVTDLQQGELLAQFAYQDLGATTAALYYDAADAYGRTITQAFRDAFETRGGQLLAVETYTTNATDFSASLQTIAAAQAQVLFLPGYDETVRQILEQANVLGIKAIFLGSDGWSSITARAAGDHETYFTQHWAAFAAPPEPRTQAFLDAHQEALGYPPFDLSALTYDAFGVLFAALERSPKLAPRSIRDTLANMADYQGLTGTITFRGRGGDPLKPLLMISMTPSGPTLRRQLLWSQDDPTGRPEALPNTEPSP